MKCFANFWNHATAIAISARSFWYNMLMKVARFFSGAVIKKIGFWKEEEIWEAIEKKLRFKLSATGRHCDWVWDVFDDAKAKASQAMKMGSRCFNGRKVFNCSCPKCVSTHLSDCVRQFLASYSESCSALGVGTPEICGRIDPWEVGTPEVSVWSLRSLGHSYPMNKIEVVTSANLPHRDVLKQCKLRDGEIMDQI